MSATRAQARNNEAGVLLVMNDIAAEADADFNRWYQEQHVPERMALPGFRAARRYRALAGNPAYMAVYLCDSISALASAAYRERLSHPTEWTRRIMPAFRNMLRAACRQTWHSGGGLGGNALVLLCKPQAGREEQARRHIVEAIGARLLAARVVMRVALWEADAKAAGGPSPEAAYRAASDQDADWVVFLETHDASHAASALEPLLTTECCAAGGLSVRSLTQYQLMCAWESAGHG